MNYNIDFFIDFYEKTKEEDWCTIDFVNSKGQRCALGMCELMSKDAQHYSLALSALSSLLKAGVILISDGHHPKYKQPHPKQRILAALYDKRKSMYPELSETTVEDIIKEALTV